MKMCYDESACEIEIECDNCTHYIVNCTDLCAFDLELPGEVKCSKLPNKQCYDCDTKKEFDDYCKCK